MALTISAITPSYNQGEFIERTILSVLNQRIPPCEYLVFDGGSTDKTVEILKKYEKHLSWISEKDKGQTDAVNKGLRVAKGDIIAWINSDDIYYPRAFETVIHFFENNPKIDIVYGKANHIDKQDKFIETYPTEPWEIKRLESTCFLSQPAVFFRRKVAEQYGILDDALSYCMDYEYWLRLAIRGAHFAYIPLVLAGSRFYLETKTLGQRPAVHAEINTMLHKLLGYTPDRWLSNYACAVLEARKISDEQKVLFLRKMIISTVLASLRWNKKISKSLMQTLKAWFKLWREAK